MFGGRRNLFKRPTDGEEEGRLVRAKLVDGHLAAKLNAIGQRQVGAKDFVAASHKSQADFYGDQRVVVKNQNIDEAGESFSHSTPLSAYERNRLNARIMKAEMKGNAELADKLRKQLESGLSSESETSKESRKSFEKVDEDILLKRVDKRTGLVMPAKAASLSRSETSTKEKKRRMAIDEKYEERKEIREMIEEEKMTSAEDQIGMFNHLAKASSSTRADDDFVVDDIFMSQKRNRKHDRHEQSAKYKKDISEHKRFEQSLDSCIYCIDSRKILKNAIVTVGLKTYLSVPTFQSLVDGHCMVIPMMHVSSSIQLDEDVFDEMKIWRKGLVAMFDRRDEDCIFVETAKNVATQPHMFIECIPISKDVAQTAPIYFKKAMMECEGEWTDNKKLVDLSKCKNEDIRRAIPKGFSYVSVDFGLQSGYAHIIENEHNVKTSFAKEIVAGMLDLDHSLWRKPQKESFEEITLKADVLRNLWKPFDWTDRVKASLKDSANESTNN